MQEELRSIAAMAAPSELGNLTLAAEDARAEWGWTRLEQTGQDVRYACRSLRILAGICGAVLAFWATPALVAYASAGRSPIALDLRSGSDGFWPG